MRYEDLKWFEVMGKGRYNVTVKVQDAYGSDWENPIDFYTDDHDEAVALRDDILAHGAEFCERMGEIMEFAEDDDVWYQVFLTDEEKDYSDMEDYYESYEAL
jgi:hypothetical protein